MKIFLSHSSRDKPLLREIGEYLAPGLREWIDEIELEWGADLEGSIKEAVNKCDLFIIFLGSEALTSPWVMRELEWAIEKEKSEKSIFVLPILIHGVNKDQIPKRISRRLFLTLNKSDKTSVKSLAEEINLRLLEILVKKYDSKAGFLSSRNLTVATQSRIEKLINCSVKIEMIKNPKTKKQLIKVLDAASKLMYVVVGAPQIYQHDHEILKGMSAGDTYRATHPFRANTKAHTYVQSVQFKAYIQEQIQAATNRGVIIKRLYILSGNSLDELNDFEKMHLHEIGRERKIDSRITYLSQIPSNDLGEDFVIFDNSLLGVAVPKKGAMLGSEYHYSIDSESETIDSYRVYFDLLFDTAIRLEEVLESEMYNRHVPVLSIEQKKNVEQPAFILQTAVSINGTEAQRLMIVLRTAGCAYDQNNMGCTMCDFKRHAANKEEINSNVLMHQLLYSLNQAMFGPDDVSQIDLLTLGSFLHDNEVPEEFQNLAFQKFSSIKELKKVAIESRSPYINDRRLLRLKKLLREDQILEIGLGIESSNEAIRNGVLRKNLSDTEIRRVVDVCANTGVEFLAYLLIGSMTLTEDEAVQDAIDSAIYIANLCKSKNVKFRIAFEPVFITHGTELENMYLQGNYKLINLWRVIEVIKAVSHLGTLFVGLSDEGLSSNRTPSGCPHCTELLKGAIDRFNGNQLTTEFEGLICRCQT